MRKIHQSPLEIFVEGYLKKFKKKSNFKSEKSFLLKAVALINAKIDSPCCDDPEAVVDLYTHRENQLTRTVRTLLAGMTKQGNTKSLTRLVLTIEKVLDDPCCE